MHDWLCVRAADMSRVLLAELKEVDACQLNSMLSPRRWFLAELLSKWAMMVLLMVEVMEVSREHAGMLWRC